MMTKGHDEEYQSIDRPRRHLLTLLERAADKLQDYRAEIDDGNDPLAQEIYRELQAYKEP